jgi:4-amino-4-deoxy-L-arabinose transferase-like glycosyltransferase
MILNRRGLPWTVPLSLGWTIIVLIVFFSTGGVLFLPLGLYLAYWVRTRQGRSAAFWCYLVVIGIAVLASLVPMTLAPYLYPIGVVGIVLLVATPLVLRGEIISLYRRSGVDLTINPILTILCSSVYLNYSIPDLPVSLQDPYPSSLVQRPGDEGMHTP